ncbi:MAG: hypothetical protein IIC78_12865 [Chloroflexi bacterium]|nr:hypothetical protein [Chloroflexota bacterium]
MRETLETYKTEMNAGLDQLWAFEELKRVVVAELAKFRQQLEQARRDMLKLNGLPFELKRCILSLLVDVIWVSSEDQTLTNEGVINGAFTSDAEQSLSLNLPLTLESSTEFAFTSARNNKGNLKVPFDCPKLTALEVRQLLLKVSFP